MSEGCRKEQIAGESWIWSTYDEPIAGSTTSMKGPVTAILLFFMSTRSGGSGSFGLILPIKRVGFE